jgi:hypothetical protein
VDVDRRRQDDGQPRVTAFPIIDVAATLAFIYLLFALACTTMNEIIAARFDRRSRMLRQGIENLLGDKALTDAVYTHPTIASLTKPHGKRAGAPSYIPSARFAAALTDHLTGEQPVTDTKALEAGILAQPAAPRRQLGLLYQLSQGNVDDFQQRVARWYDETMDRVTGWYKRAVQRQTYIMAAVIVLALNLDSVQLFNRAWSDSAFRSAAIDQAKARIDALGTAEVPVIEYTEGDNPNAGTPVQVGTASLTDSEQQLLTSLRGWQDDRRQLTTDLVLRGSTSGVRVKWFARTLRNHLLGWLITLLAISLGAPFWFDLLNKFMNLRHAGRAPDERPSKA